MTVQADTNASAGYSNIPFTRGIVTSRDPGRQRSVCLRSQNPRIIGSAASVPWRGPPFSPLSGKRSY